MVVVFLLVLAVLGALSPEGVAAARRAPKNERSWLLRGTPPARDMRWATLTLGSLATFLAWCTFPEAYWHALVFPMFLLIAAVSFIYAFGLGLYESFGFVLVRVGDVLSIGNRELRKDEILSVECTEEQIELTLAGWPGVPSTFLFGRSSADPALVGACEAIDAWYNHRRFLRR